MAILKIARMGHPVLQRRADPVTDPQDPAVAQLIADMLETLADAEAAGLAAPQVHAPLRLVIFRVLAARNNGEAVPLTVLINPEIEVVDGSLQTSYEGCLSLPGLTGAVPRVQAIRYRGLVPDGEKIDRLAEGFHARVVQHECDHLDGILYPMRMPSLATFGFSDEVRKVLMAE